MLIDFKKNSLNDHDYPGYPPARARIEAASKKFKKKTFADTSDKTVPIVSMQGIHQSIIPTTGGNALSIFYNKDTGLVVVSLGNDKGGTDLLRTTMNEKELLAHCK